MRSGVQWAARRASLDGARDGSPGPVRRASCVLSVASDTVRDLDGERRKRSGHYVH